MISNRLIFFVGVGVLVLVVLAPLRMATIHRLTNGPVRTVTDLNTGQTFSARLIGFVNTTPALCVDSDRGFKPLVTGNVSVTATDRNGSYTLLGGCIDANTLREPVCGEDVNVNGIHNDFNAYVFSFNCGDINKVCVAGACV